MWFLIITIIIKNETTQELYFDFKLNEEDGEEGNDRIEREVHKKLKYQIRNSFHY